MELDLQKIHNAIEESDRNLTSAIQARDEQVSKIGKVTADVQKRVANAEASALAATRELKDRFAEVVKTAGQMRSDMVETKNRLEEVEKRFGGRPGPGGARFSGQAPEFKTIGQRFIETMKSDQFAPTFEALKSGHKNGPSVIFEGSDFSDQLAARMVLKASGIPYSAENLGLVMAQKATIGTADATRLVAPFRDVMVPPLKRQLTIRDFMTVRPVTSNSVEFVEQTGLGPETGSAVTSMTRVGTVVTVTTTAAHGLRQGETVEISGTVETDYNGMWQVSVTGSGTFTFDIGAATPTTPATGTILMRNMSHYGAAAGVTEGNVKPEARMKFDLKTALIQTIAHWIPATRQVLDDLAELQAMIDNDLSFGIQDAEEIGILYGSGASPQIQGILTHPKRQLLAQGSLTALNSLRRAITYIQLVRMSANLIVMNPLDWDAVETAVSTADEHYLLVGGAAGSDEKVWRVPVLATTAILPKSVLVGAFDMGATLYDRQQVSVRFSEHHASFFISNLLAILAEERVGTAWKRPQAFVDLTLT